MSRPFTRNLTTRLGHTRLYKALEHGLGNEDCVPIMATGAELVVVNDRKKGNAFVSHCLYWYCKSLICKWLVVRHGRFLHRNPSIPRTPARPPSLVKMYGQAYGILDSLKFGQQGPMLLQQNHTKKNKPACRDGVLFSKCV